MCDCRSDWVVRFRRDCERAAALNEAYRRQIRRSTTNTGMLELWFSIHQLQRHLGSVFPHICPC